ncbi:LysR family transcriptional regulator [Brevibacillus nitrificans]|uniref:LysR family transcriptional regulator n=1 Tax=Brevibacillus nitrificans TaxID=651560 RepID=UPI002863408C|nr:LysR family transcriptional regulator [Brevibacillus nitrificans]MDR7319415.1 DNA-binding transcriptional LysR family regulator [Brevibacillus nitrificans]
MNEKDYLMLKYIYEVQNLTKAAELLYITPPALTYRLQQLEKEFGVSIITKNGRSIEFTPEGRYLVQYAKKALIDLRKTKDHMLNMGSEVQGILRLGVSRVIAHYKLPPILKEFLNLYPKVEINVNTGISDEVYELLRSNEVQVGIVRGSYTWSEQKHLLKEEGVYIISKNRLRIEDLPTIPRINYRNSTDFNEEINNWWYERFTDPPLINMQVDTFEICKEMVKNDLGYAIIPQIFLYEGDPLYKEELIARNGTAVTMKTWMLYRESSTHLAMVGKFVNHLKSLDIMEY